MDVPLPGMRARPTARLSVVEVSSDDSDDDRHGGWSGRAAAKRCSGSGSAHGSGSGAGTSGSQAAGANAPCGKTKARKRAAVEDLDDVELTAEELFDPAYQKRRQDAERVRALLLESTKVDTVPEPEAEPDEDSEVEVVEVPKPTPKPVAPPPTAPPRKYNLKVRVGGGAESSVKMFAHQTFKKLVDKLCQATGYDPAQAKLRFDGDVLLPHKKIEDTEIEDDDMLDFDPH